MSADKKFVLPDASPQLKESVRAWEQAVMLETYEPQAPNCNPMFLENRVYQGSSGKVYPLPLTERVAQRSTSRSWRALHIENEFLRVMILPELGGRIHVGLDKTNGYDFFYRQNVIKPALVGLAGPWASGGVEFNWPQHHRPGTYMPVEPSIEQHADGSATVWCSDHDPFQRMKSAHGVCLHPGKSIIELKVRLFNRTTLTQTFLWWANAATRVHELYQSFFPPDVHFVADHAKRAMSTYPLCSGNYYGVDYARRAQEGVPNDELPAKFIPTGSYPPNDLRWYANIPVPTSYMAVHSEADFFGGYDHRRKAGLIHIANHHIAPGKKQWTWGNHEFGYGWDRQLTDDDGPYIELMAGVFTDNQPDFSFLEPGETKTFSQFWYPIRDIGIAHAANLRVACHVKHSGNALLVSLHTTEQLSNVRVEAIGGRSNDREESDSSWTGDVGPANPVTFEIAVPFGQQIADCGIRVMHKSEEILQYQPAAATKLTKRPDPATEPPLPRDVETVEELYLIGKHLEQYRHATRDPIGYWREALLRDPGESRCLEAIALWHLRRGEFSDAEGLLEQAIKRITRYNGNPQSGSAFYHLGIAQRFLGRDREAYDALYKATWNFAFRSAAFYATAEIDTSRGEFAQAITHLEGAQTTNADDLRTRNLQAVLLRKLERPAEAARILAANEALDPTDFWTAYLLKDKLPQDNQMLLDLAYDYSRAGLHSEAYAVCLRADFSLHDGSVPMIYYTLAFLDEKQDKADSMHHWLREAYGASPDYCFPNRLEDLQILQWAIYRNPKDVRAHYYLGNLLYDKRRYEEAIAAWEASVKGEHSLATAWRNLGIAYFNIRQNVVLARNAFDRAFALSPQDGRIFFERDQLWKRTNTPQAERLRELTTHKELAVERDDLSIETINLLNQARQHETALRMLSERSFQPWEGGEGLVMEQHVRTHIALGREALLKGNPAAAHSHFQAALESPQNLGEAKHLLGNRANVYFWLGESSRRLAVQTDAKKWWQKAVSAERDFQEMSVIPFSPMSFYRVLAFERLGREQEARLLLAQLRSFAKELEHATSKVDYFATSLPNTLLFRDDLQQRQRLYALFLEAQSFLAGGDRESGEQLLQQILQEQPSSSEASDLLEESECFERLGMYGASQARSGGLA